MAGALAGIYFTAIASPAKDFSIWIGLFAIIGVIAANVVLLIIYEISKPIQPPADTASKIA